MLTSSSMIADALITMFSAASQFGTGNVSKNSYQVLETSTGSCMMVQWTSYADKPSTMGTFGQTSKQRTWNMNLKCYIRDTGDPVAVLNRVWTATDNILACLNADETLQGTVDEVTQVEGSHDPETAFTVGGATWLTIDFNVAATCF
jgi:hypothetical protein